MSASTINMPAHSNHVVVSVLGADQSGIVAAIATELANAGANIIDISQTILSGIFSMTMIVELDEDKTSFDELLNNLEKTAEDLGVQVTMQREDVFRFMYQIDPESR